MGPVGPVAPAPLPAPPVGPVGPVGPPGPVGPVDPPDPPPTIGISKIGMDAGDDDAPTAGQAHTRMTVPDASGRSQKLM